MHVVLVCRSGGDYAPRSVEKLREQIRDLPIIVLTDFEKDNFHPDIEVRKLNYNWPGWWSKLEFFRHDLFYLDCLYLDLDTVVCDDLAPLKRDGFAMWVDPFGHGFNSSVMFKPRECETLELYQQFEKSPFKYMQEFAVGKGMPWGDQAYIQKHQKTRGKNYTAPEVVSWKKDGHPDDARVLVFHGEPKPYEAGYV